MSFLQPAISKITVVFLFLLLSMSELMNALPEAAPSSPSSSGSGSSFGSGSEPDSNIQLPPFNLYLKKAVIFAQPDLEGPIVSLTFESANTNESNIEDSENNSGGLSFSTTLGNSARFRTFEYRRNRPPMLGPDGELVPPPSRIPLPPPLVQTWRRIVPVDVDDVDGDEGFNELLGGGRDASGGSRNIKFEVWLYNYRGPEDFAVRIKLAESSGPIWSVSLSGYMRKIPLKPSPEPFDITYTSEPERLPPLVMVGDENGNSIAKDS